ncbi:MAG: polysaccharide biosynthesis/export family protein [Muribaculaceae bacterium]
MRLHLLAIICASLLLASCTTSKQNLSYFENISTSEAGTLPSGSYDITILPDDELTITVTSVVPEATAAYNLPMTNPALIATSAKTATKNATQAQLQTYIVDKDGYITFPILGKLKVSGLTITQISDMLINKISQDVQDPFVSVMLVNFRINVLGEVKNPGQIDVTRQRFSILDALAKAGDLTEYGVRSNVLLIREENGVKTYHRLNLNDSAMLSSPYFYLQQNDVVYVEPNKIRKDNSKYNQNNSFKVSVIATIVSAVSVIASLVIALVIK